MKRILISLILVVAVGAPGKVLALDVVRTEAMLALLAGASAANPEVAAAVDVLVFLSVPNSPGFKTPTQKTIAYLGMGALALYNYEADEEDHSREDLFVANFVVFNLVIASELLGLNEPPDPYSDFQKPSSSFGIELTPELNPGLVWQYRF